MEFQSTPRITAPYLDSYQGRNVIVVGRVVQLRGETALIDSDGNITAHLNRVRDDLFQVSVPIPNLPVPCFQPCEFHTSILFYARTQSADMAAIPGDLQEAHLSNGNAVQIIGKVNPDLSIKVLSALDLGTGVGTCAPPRLQPTLPTFPPPFSRDGGLPGRLDGVLTLPHQAIHSPACSLGDITRSSRDTLHHDQVALTSKPHTDFNVYQHVVEISQKHGQLFGTN